MPTESRVSANCVADPAVTENEFDAISVRGSDVKVITYEPEVPTMQILEKVATPEAAVAVISVASEQNVPLPEVIRPVITAAEVLTLLLLASRTSTTTFDIFAPLATVAGCVVIANLVAAFGVPVTAVEAIPEPAELTALIFTWYPVPLLNEELPSLCVLTTNGEEAEAPVHQVEPLSVEYS